MIRISLLVLICLLWFSCKKNKEESSTYLGTWKHWYNLISPGGFATADVISDEGNLIVFKNGKVSYYNNGKLISESAYTIVKDTCFHCGLSPRVMDRLNFSDQPVTNTTTFIEVNNDTLTQYISNAPGFFAPPVSKYVRVAD